MTTTGCIITIQEIGGGAILNGGLLKTVKYCIPYIFMFSSNKLEKSKFVSSLGLTHPLLGYLTIKILTGYKTVIVIEVSIILKSIFM